MLDFNSNSSVCCCGWTSSYTGALVTGDLEESFSDCSCSLWWYRCPQKYPSVKNTIEQIVDTIVISDEAIAIMASWLSVVSMEKETYIEFEELA